MHPASNVDAPSCERCSEGGGTSRVRHVPVSCYRWLGGAPAAVCSRLDACALLTTVHLARIPTTHSVLLTCVRCDAKRLCKLFVRRYVYKLPGDVQDTYFILRIQLDFPVTTSNGRAPRMGNPENGKSSNLDSRRIPRSTIWTAPLGLRIAILSKIYATSYRCGKGRLS